MKKYSEKELKKIDVEEFSELVFDMSNEFYGYEVEITIQKKAEHYWTLEIYDENYFTDGTGMKDVLLNLYSYIVEEIFIKEHEKEWEEQEKEDDRLMALDYARSCGVPCGKY